MTKLRSRGRLRYTFGCHWLERGCSDAGTRGDVAVGVHPAVGDVPYIPAIGDMGQVLHQGRALLAS
ncbi:MAG: hypothetical protein M1376_04975, partial [Planctomycetes bacterium]|nr:hypothetical protein [Planctomycetota bacterium]